MSKHSKYICLYTFELIPSMFSFFSRSVEFRLAIQINLKKKKSTQVRRKRSYLKKLRFHTLVLIFRKAYEILPEG